MPRDGAETQDCERNAAKRWLARHSAAVGHLRPVYLGDDLFACQPIVAAIQDAGGSFILACKPASHQTITEYLHGTELQGHRQTICERGKHTTTVYRWFTAVPLRATADAIAVTWFSIEIFHDKGKRTYHNSFVTDLAVSADTVAELAACGRARRKIENETFNVLKTGGYNLERNFGHRKETSPMSSSPSTRWPLPSIPPLISPFLPGEPLSSRVAPNTTSSSICGPSPPTWSSSTGTTCFNPSPRPPSGHLEQTGIPSRT
ncbi:MAG TPA: hypothetical protein VFE41_27680 [Acetobacteraceae bacterium]|nr:hypothetical protein [Acetobacteraceae bacterium]